MKSVKIPPSVFSKVNQPIRQDSEENLSMESSEDELEDHLSTIPTDNHDDDDRLAKLAEWEPENPIKSEDEDEEVIREELPSIDVDISPMLPSPSEDLLVTYVHCPQVKIEPIIPQLDGQNDLIVNVPKLKRLRRKRKTSVESSSRTLFDYFPVIKRPSITPGKISKIRPPNYFDNCIILDDDDDDIRTVHQ